MNALELYDDSVRRLPASERLRLAALILDDLAISQSTLLDSGVAWSQQDMSDLTIYSLGYAATIYPECEELA